jgi:polysaccharide deacetylase family protein (PEP-CTERM system associated)
MNANPAIRNAFTVDVEDYFHVTAFARIVSPRHWNQYESRVVANTHRILELLDEFQVRGTFFVLGWVARHYPNLVRDIQKAGHEIGCHSFWHRLIYEMSPDEFRSDLVEAKDTIEQITGETVTAFRAPSFSITHSSLWALAILYEEGIRFDSSIYPVMHDRYGIPGAERVLHRLETSAGTLWQFPPAVFSAGPLKMAMGGGGYFRLYPVRATQMCLARINRTAQPFMFYVHPWEIDPAQPTLPGTRLNRFRHYVNLAQTERKLRRMLACFSFGSMSDAISERASSDSAALIPSVGVDEGRLNSIRPAMPIGRTRDLASPHSTVLN